MRNYKFITMNQYIKTLSLWVSYNFLYYNLTSQDCDAYYEVFVQHTINEKIDNDNKNNQSALH